jgi:hypothetical protein
MRGGLDLEEKVGGDIINSIVTNNVVLLIIKFMNKNKILLAIVCGIGHGCH